MKVSELIERLKAMDPDATVASFSRWWPEREHGKNPVHQAEVIAQVVQCEFPRERDRTESVRVVCFNPSFTALDYAIGDRDKDSKGNPR